VDWLAVAAESLGGRCACTSRIGRQQSIKECFDVPPEVFSTWATGCLSQEVSGLYLVWRGESQTVEALRYE